MALGDINLGALPAYMEQIQARDAGYQRVADLLGGSMLDVMGGKYAQGAAKNERGSTLNQLKPIDVKDGKLVYQSFSPEVFTGNKDRVSIVYQGWKNPEWMQQQLQSGKITMDGGNFLVDPSIINDPNFGITKVDEYRGPNTGRGVTGLGSNLEKFIATSAGILTGAGMFGPQGFVGFGGPTVTGTEALGAAEPFSGDMSWLLDGVSTPSINGVNPAGLGNYLAPELGGLTGGAAGTVGGINTAGLGGLLAPGLTLPGTVGVGVATPNSGVSVTSGGQTISQPGGISSGSSWLDKAKKAKDIYDKAEQVSKLLGGGKPQQQSSGGQMPSGGGLLGSSNRNATGYGLLDIQKPKYVNLFSPA